MERFGERWTRRSTGATPGSTRSPLKNSDAFQPPLGEQLETHSIRSPLHHAELASGGIGKVDHPTLHERAPIVDVNDRRASVPKIGDPHATAERQRAMGRGQDRKSVV